MLLRFLKTQMIAVIAVLFIVIFVSYLADGESVITFGAIGSIVFLVAVMIMFVTRYTIGDMAVPIFTFLSTLVAIIMIPAPTSTAIIIVGMAATIVMVALAIFAIVTYYRKDALAHEIHFMYFIVAPIVDAVIYSGILYFVPKWI